MREGLNETGLRSQDRADKPRSAAKRPWATPQVIVASSLVRTERQTSPPAADSHNSPFHS